MMSNIDSEDDETFARRVFRNEIETIDGLIAKLSRDTGEGQSFSQYLLSDEYSTGDILRRKLHEFPTLFGVIEIRASRDVNIDKLSKHLEKTRLLLQEERSARMERLSGLLKLSQPTLENPTLHHRLPLHPMKRTRSSSDGSANTSGQATPMKTPASLGSQEKERLVSEQSFVQFQGEPGQASVLGEDEQRQLDACTEEDQVVAFLTPHFEKTFGEGICVVNSEQFAWLKTSGGDTRYKQEPDLFFCHRAIYTPRDPASDLEGKRSDSDKFGVLSDWRLRDCLCATGEAKLKINSAAFGEVINYGTHICFGKDSSPPDQVKLILVDKSEFWLVESTRGFVTKVTTCGWVVDGSRNLLSGFPFTSPTWMQLLDAACNSLNLFVGENAFLGAGAFGRVFQVRRKTQDGIDPTPLALKLVLPGDEQENIHDLDCERKWLIEAGELLPQSVMGVEKEYFSARDVGAALLLSHVGKKVDPSSYKEVIMSLANLHQKLILHGDARLANVVSYEGRMLWIDFRRGFMRLDSIVGFQRDMISLVKSLRPGKPVSEALYARLLSYDRKQETAIHIITAYEEWWRVA